MIGMPYLIAEVAQWNILWEKAIYQSLLLLFLKPRWNPGIWHFCSPGKLHLSGQWVFTYTKHISTRKSSTSPHAPNPAWRLCMIWITEPLPSPPPLSPPSSPDEHHNPLVTNQKSQTFNSILESLLGNCGEAFQRRKPKRGEWAWIVIFFFFF